MINESTFFIHILIILAFTFVALKFKKEGLFAIVSIFAILANLLVTKQTTLFGLCVTCTDVFIVGGALSLNLIQDFYDKKTALKAIYFSLISLIFYVTLTQLHLFYSPAICDFTQSHYQAIFEFMPRIIIASIFCYFISQTIDAYLYAFLKKTKLNFILRNYISLSLSQLVDTILFSFLGLYGIVDNIWHIILFSYLIKLLCAIIIVPIVKIGFKKVISV